MENNLQFIKITTNLTNQFNIFLFFIYGFQSYITETHVQIGYSYMRIHLKLFGRNK